MKLQRFALYEKKDEKKEKKETNPNEKKFKTILKSVFNAGCKDEDFNEYWEKSGESLCKKLEGVCCKEEGEKEEGGKDEKSSKGGKNPHKFGTKEFWDFQKSMKKSK